MADESFAVDLVVNVKADSAKGALNGVLEQVRQSTTGLDGQIDKIQKGLNGVGGASKVAASGLANTRYALYDVSTTLAVTGAALLAIPAASLAVAVSFERDFANVKRTVGGSDQVLGRLKSTLIDLSTTIPVTFEGLTKIATLGGQLGIGASDIGDFTSTVAKLTATTDLSAEAAGTALGRFKAFGLVTGKQFEELASSILKVGVNSVATESQIVAIATGIAGIGKVAGLSAATLIGYSGALASVGIQQYAARGTTQRLLTEIQKASSEGGEKLDTFAKIAGVSSEKLASSFGTSKFDPIFRSLVTNLGDTSRTGKDLNTTLSDLGINSVIDRRTLLQLSAAPKAVKDAFADASSGIKDNTEINRQYGKVAETTSAKLAEFTSSVKAFLNALGTSATGPIGGVVDLLKDMTKAFTDFIKTPSGQTISLLVLSISALGGALLLVSALAARGVASFLAITQALAGMNAEAGLSSGIFAGLNAELAASGPIGTKAAAGFSRIGTALKALGAITLIATLSSTLNSAIDQLRTFSGARDGVDGLSKSLDKTGDSYKKVIDGIVNSKGIFGTSGILGNGNAAQSSHSFDWFFSVLQGIKSGVAGLGNVSANIASSFDSTGILKFRDDLKTLDVALGNEAVKNPQQAAVQYAYLSDKLKEAGYSTKEIRALLPESTQALATNSEEVKKAAAAQQELADKIGVTGSFLDNLTLNTGLNADGISKWVQGYQKSVSTLTDFNGVVGQVQKALQDSAQAQADAANANKDAGDAASKATDFYDGQSVSLQQFTDQLNANNGAQETWAQNLVLISTQYGPAAAQGFIDAGYSAVNASILQQLVDATPEQAAAYIAAQEQAAQLASDATATALLASGYLVTNAGGAIGTDTAKKLADGIKLGLPVEQLMQSLNIRFAANPIVPAANTSPAQSALDSFVYNNNGRTITFNVRTNSTSATVVGSDGSHQNIPIGKAAGGYISGAGTGTSDSIPARLSNGEYVVRAAAVQKYGTGFLNALNAARVPKFASGGQVGSPSAGSMGGVIELGPKSLNRLSTSVTNNISIDAVAISRAAQQGDQIRRSTGELH